MTTTKGDRTRRKTGAAEWRNGARALGITTADTMALIRRVRTGLPFRCFARFQEQSGLSREKLADFADIQVRTLTRRQYAGRLQPQESDRVLRASRVFGMAVELFEGDVPAARQWLLTPQVGLGGEPPLEFASTDAGAREVEHLIGRLEHGVFS